MCYASSCGLGWSLIGRLWDVVIVFVAVMSQLQGLVFLLFIFVFKSLTRLAEDTVISCPALHTLETLEFSLRGYSSVPILNAGTSG